MAEGLFAVGNMFSFCRICFFLPANQQLGPLQISLGNMLTVCLFFLLLLLIYMVNSVYYTMLIYILGFDEIYWNFFDHIFSFYARFE
jgi:hypothetical protein